MDNFKFAVLYIMISLMGFLTNVNIERNKDLINDKQSVTLNAEFTYDNTMYAMSLPSDQGKCEMFVNSKNNLMRCVWVMPHNEHVILCPTTHEVVPSWIEPTDDNIENYCND